MRSVEAAKTSKSVKTSGGIATDKAKAPRPADGMIRPRLRTKGARATAAEDFKSSVVTVRVKDQLKDDAEQTFAQIGISLPEAVRVFLSRVVSEGGFPFRLETPNAATRAAMEDGRRSEGRFATAEGLFDDLEKGAR